MESKLKEARIILVIDIIKIRYIKNYKETTKLYNIFESILYIRIIVLHRGLASII
jgi:hypothetical protein